MWPLATNRHKSFYDICGKPILAHTIGNLAKNGFDEIMLIADARDEPLARKVAESAAPAKVRVVKSGDHGGMGEELLKVASLLDGETIVTSGHAVNAGENAKALLGLGACDAAFCVQECADVSEYGAVILGKDGKTVREIVEKPAQGGAGMRIVGVYRVGKSFISQLQKTPKGHYSFEAALNATIGNGTVKACKVDGYQPTMKYPWQLLALKKFIMERTLPAKPQISNKATIHKSATIEGRVKIEDGARVMENAVIKGPAYIGENAVVGTGALVRDYADMERESAAGHCTEVKNSLVGAGSHLHRAFCGDSVLGEKCRLAANAVLANRRFDRATVKSRGKDEGQKDTGLDYFGAVLGAGAFVGVNASVMPGVKLGAGAGVMPNCVAKQDAKEGEIVG